MNSRSIFRLSRLARLAPTMAFFLACRSEEATPRRVEPAPSAPSVAVPAPSTTPSPSSPSSAPRPAFDVETPPTLGKPAAVEIVPALPAFERGMMDHASIVGWSKDSKEFGYCMESGGTGATRCEFVTPDGKTEKLDDFDRERGEADELRSQAIRRRIAERGYAVTKPEWPHARDLVIAWKVRPRTEAASKIAAPRLEVGARTRDEKEERASLTLLPPENTDWHELHPEAIAVSPDGKYLGVAYHAFAGEFSDTFGLRVVPTRVVAGQAYNDRGLALHGEKRFEEAAGWFHLAAHTNPESKVAFYNLACALARTRDRGAEAALRRALEVDPGARKKARTDEDFAAVRAESWFLEATADTPR